MKRQIVLLLFKAVLAGSPLLAIILYQVICPRARRRRHWSSLINCLWPVGLTHAAISSQAEEEVGIPA
ncbi:hypothetical protein IV102_23680 [bacterium]|nr:hypothetical protein [bacterium]